MRVLVVVVDPPVVPPVAPPTAGSCGFGKTTERNVVAPCATATSCPRGSKVRGSAFSPGSGFVRNWTSPRPVGPTSRFAWKPPATRMS
jgi:hypothetical protein